MKTNSMVIDFDYCICFEIIGKELTSLQDYVDVLSKYFPSRLSTKHFLNELRTWILGHDDAIRGDDLANQVKLIKNQVGAFKDLRDEVISCNLLSYRSENFVFLVYWLQRIRE